MVDRTAHPGEGAPPPGQSPCAFDLTTHPVIKGCVQGPGAALSSLCFLSLISSSCLCLLTLSSASPHLLYPLPPLYLEMGLLPAPKSTPSSGSQGHYQLKFSLRAPSPSAPPLNSWQLWHWAQESPSSCSVFPASHFPVSSEIPLTGSPSCNSTVSSLSCQLSFSLGLVSLPYFGL